jgi:hypothetical protein
MENNLILEENKKPDGHQSTKLVTVQTQSHHYLLSKTIKINKERVSLDAREVIPLSLPNIFACVYVNPRLLF